MQNATIGTGRLPVIFGCSGPVLTEEERRFFEKCKPLGFILFARNIQSAGQVKGLITALRQSVNGVFADTPVLIDQEGGRVQRIQLPGHTSVPPMAQYGTAYALNPEMAAKELRTAIRQQARELKELGFSVNCSPCLDLSSKNNIANGIGDRSFSESPHITSVLGGVALNAMLEEGIMPVIKHIPGHGRANADSHKALPVVETPLAELESTDWEPFSALKSAPWAMTAHIVVQALDPGRPVTISSTAIRAIREELGYDGVLISDDLSMDALTGSLDQRARQALESGCDLALHCNGELEEMRAITAALPPLTTGAARRLTRAETMRGLTHDVFDLGKPERMAS